MDDTDYSEIVDGTIEEVREKIESRGLDLEKVLEAEKQGKNRVTLVEWLEETIEETRGTSGTSDSHSDLNAQVRELVTSRFVPGLAIGLVLGTLLVFSGLVQDSGGAAEGLSPGEISSSVEEYFGQGFGDLPVEGANVSSVERMNGSDMYRVSMALQVNATGQIVEQPQTAFVTPEGRYIFFGSPIDTDVPVSDQLLQPQ